jgi:hypothetical protein
MGCYLLPLALVTCQVAGASKSGAKASPEVAERPAVTFEDARLALHQMVESDAFLSDVPYLATLRTRIRAENKKDPLLNAGMRSSAPGGNFIGPWLCDTGSGTFSYIAKSAKRDELLVIQGRFLLGRDGKWSAKITEASATKLSNLFGQPELDKVKEGMPLTEVTKTLGVPPGAYYSEIMAFTYPDVRRSWPFTGSSSEFKEFHPHFFAIRPLPAKEEWFKRAWISNEMAIWIYFDSDWKVQYAHKSRITCPNEWWNELHMPKGLPDLDFRKKK